MMRADLLARAERLRAERVPFVLATVVRAQRPTSAKAGDSALVLADGTIDGFIGGTCAESAVRLEGLRMLAEGSSTLLRITPEPDGAAAAERDEGLTTVSNPCLSGGSLDIFLESTIPPPLMYVFGDGQIARSLITIGSSAGYDVVAASTPDGSLPAGCGAVVVASHGRDEEPVLRAALRGGVPYIALVASRKRAAAVLASLGADAAGRVHSPAGLDIGARTPAEVAVSILAELVSVRPRVPTMIADVSIVDAIDPVCGMTVVAAPETLSLEHGGRVWYFCGSGCRTAFAEVPERYAPEPAA